MAYPFLGVTLWGPAPDMPVVSLPRWHPGKAWLQARQGRPRWCPEHGTWPGGLACVALCLPAEPPQPPFLTKDSKC